MADKNLEIALKLTSDGKILVAEVKKSKQAVDNLASSTTSAGGRMRSSFERAGQSVDAINRKLNNLQNLAVGFLGASVLGGFARDFITTADNVRLLEARMLQATGSTSAFNQAMADSATIAREARSDYEATANLMAKLSTAADQYGIEQTKITATTEAVTYGLKLFGASAGEASSATLQLAQALSSGLLAGDEFKSMAEASPRLMQALADGLGVARGELKQMAADSELTTERVVNALSGQADVLKAEFANMPATVSEAWGQITNQMTMGIAELNASLGITDSIAQGMLWLADNVGLVSDAFTIATVSAGAFYAVNNIGTITALITKFTGLGTAINAINFTRSLGDLIKLEKALGATSTRAALGGAALKQFGGIASFATGAVRTLGVAIMANPIGLLVTGLAAAVTYLWQFGDEIYPVADSIANLHDYAKAAFDYIGDSLSGIAESVTGWFSESWDVAGQAMSGLKEWGSETFGDLGGIMDTFVNYAKDSVNRQIGFWVGGFRAIGAVWDNFPGFMANVAAKAANFVLDHINSMVKGMATLLNNLPGIDIDIDGLGFKRLEETGVSAMEAVKAAFVSGFEDDYIGAAAAGVGIVLDGITDKVTDIGRAWKEDAEEIAKWRKAAENDSLNDNLGETIQQTERVAASSDKAGKATKGLSDAQKEAAQAAKEAAKAQQQLENRVDSLLQSLFPVEAKFAETQQTIADLSAAVGGEAANALAKYGLNAEQLVPVLNELAIAQSLLRAGMIDDAAYIEWIDNITDGMSDFKKETEKTSTVFEEQFKRAIQSVDQAFADMWANLLNGSGVTFDSIADSFRNIAAEILHGQTTGQLTEWLSGAFSGSPEATGSNDQGIAGLQNTTQTGFDKMVDSFDKFAQESLGLSSETTAMMGKMATSAMVGYAAGGLASELFGGDEQISQLAGSIGGAAATGIASAMGAGAAAGPIGMAIGAAIAIFASAATRKKTSESHYYSYADGTVEDSMARDFDKSDTAEPVKAFWESVWGQASIYGVEIAEKTLVGYTVKSNKKGFRRYFGVNDEAGNNIFDKRLYEDDAKDAEQVALAFAQMQVAALSQADWSEYTASIGTAWELVLEDLTSMSMEDITAYHDYIKQTERLSKSYAEAAAMITGFSDVWDGSLTDLQIFTESVYEIARTLGNDAVADLESYLQAMDATSEQAADTAQAFAIITQALDLFDQTTDQTGQAVIEMSETIVEAFGSAEQAATVFAGLFDIIGTDLAKAGTGYEQAQRQVDALNRELGLTGSASITSIEALRAYVAALDPASDAYAENMNWAYEMAQALQSSADAASYFTNAIDSVNASLSDTMTDIREDMMSDEELYRDRKDRAEDLAASLAGLTDVAEIEDVTQQINDLVNSMWNSLSDDQQTDATGQWMIDFLNEIQALSTGRIEELQNGYGANNELSAEYESLRDFANALTAQDGIDLTGITEAFAQVGTDIGALIDGMASGEINGDLASQLISGIQGINADQLAQIQGQLSEQGVDFDVSALVNAANSSADSANTQVTVADRQVAVADKQQIAADGFTSAADKFNASVTEMDGVVGELKSALANINVQLNINRYDYGNDH